jgi:hypothetical protein
MNTGSFRSLASASARPKSSSMNGTAGFHADVALFVVTAFAGALFAGAVVLAAFDADAISAASRSAGARRVNMPRNVAEHALRAHVCRSPPAALVAREAAFRPIDGSTGIVHGTVGAW